MTPDPDANQGREAARRFLTFRTHDRLYALPAEAVAEVIRLPTVARVPLGPASLLGVANLRGAVLPVASLRGLLGLKEIAASDGARAIVLHDARAVALAVDGIHTVVSVEADQVETRQAQLAAHPGEALIGAIPVSEGDGQDVAKILDIQSLLAVAFERRAQAPRAVAPTLTAPVAAAQVQHAQTRLVTFEVSEQLYAFELDDVREVLPAPEAVASVPHAEALVLGVAAYRGSLLPLLSLRGLLGFAPPEESAGREREKVIVLAVAGVLVGLVADRMRAVLSLDPALIEPAPAMLAARAGGEARIKALYRDDQAGRLVSILQPDHLFREDVMQKLAAGSDAQAETSAAPAHTSASLQVLVFRLGEDEFGLPIEAVDEVTRAPDQVTRVPKAPKFLEGVINLRGEVLPVIDQRRRFDMPRLEAAESRRLVVLRAGRHRAGLIVDSVSQVLRCAMQDVAAPPELTEDMNRLVRGVVNLPDSHRIILLLDPEELLTRSERKALDAFDAAAGQGAA